tara:strand:- start:9667 stop:10029 length:363 start_codon:yes stop_codon:yes gene_type:complete
MNSTICKCGTGLFFTRKNDKKNLISSSSTPLGELRKQCYNKNCNVQDEVEENTALYSETDDILKIDTKTVTRQLQSSIVSRTKKISCAKCSGDIVSSMRYNNSLSIIFRCDKCGELQTQF